MQNRCKRKMPYQACRKRVAGWSFSPPLPHFWQISQPGRGHIIPTQYYKHHRIFRPCDGPAVCFKDLKHFFHEKFFK